MSGNEQADGRSRLPPVAAGGFAYAVRTFLRAGVVSDVGRTAGLTCRDEPIMIPEADHFRLAVATFDEPLSLSRAVEALIAAGLSVDQLCLLARRETLRDLADAPQGASAAVYGTLVSAFDSWPGASADLVATAGLLRDSLVHLQTQETPRGADCGSQATQRPDFGDWLGDRAVTIIVRSRTPAQQSVSTRTLLSQSSHRVKTYEFTFAPCPEGKH